MALKESKKAEQANTYELVVNVDGETFDKAINVYTIGEFSGDLEADVKDPYGKGVEEYDKCFTQLEGMLGKAAHNIKKALDDSAEKRKEEKYDRIWM